MTKLPDVSVSIYYKTYLQRNRISIFSGKITAVIYQPCARVGCTLVHLSGRLFRVLEIQIIRCNGQWKVEGTVAIVHTISQGG